MHARRIGYKNYIALGPKYTIGELIREQEVFDKLIEFKQLLTQSEIAHAVDYINQVRFLYGKKPVSINFELNDIPRVRPAIKIQTVLNKK